jgi:hypothetical protein
MKTSYKPVRTTIVIGGLGGLAFLLTGMIGTPIGLRPWLCFGIIWCLLAAYALALAGWSGCRGTDVIFPLLILGGIGIALPRAGVVFGLTLVILSWLRSGICYPRSGFQALFREVLLCGGGGLVLVLWQPSAPLSWALGIWLFSLVQALFFILFESGTPALKEAPPDRFDQARRRIEELLEG